MSAMDNGLNPHSISLQLGTVSADATLPGIAVRKPMVLKRMSLLNQLGIAADNTNYVKVQLQKVSDSSVVAEIDTRAAAEGAATALVPLLAGETDVELAAGSHLKVVVDVQGTAVLTLASLELELHQK